MVREKGTTKASFEMIAWLIADEYATHSVTDDQE